jgi:cellulose biosynthesis protein BcsS
MRLSCRTLCLGLAVILGVSTAVYAQDGAPGSTTTQNTADAAAAAQSAPAARSIWEPMAGFEIDSRSTGYTFFGPQYRRHLNDNVSFVARAFGNYLFYEFEEDGGTTSVRAPGLSTEVGLRFGNSNWFQVTGGPGFRRSTRRFAAPFVPATTSDSEWRTGVDVGADAWVNPTNRTNLMAQAHYGTADDYLWSRLVGRRQITNYSWTDHLTHYIGGEVIGQGNEDIRSVSVGALYEFVHVPSSASIALRAGYKRSMFDVAPDKTGPYFAIGYYQRFQ